MKHCNQSAPSEASTEFDEACISSGETFSSKSSAEDLIPVELLDGCDEGIEIPLRGWSMRRGHMRKAAKPKTGKAAMWAEIQGQGTEVSKGRSVFKRSVNNGSQNRWYREYSWGEGKKSEKRQVWKRVIAEYACDHYEQFDFCEGVAMHYYDDEAEWEWAPIDSYAPVEEEKRPAVEKESSLKFSDVDRLATRLKPCGAVLDKTRLQGCDGFATLQKHFLGQFGPSFCRELSRSLRRIIHVKAAPVSENIQRRFLDAHSTLGGALRPAYHGTNVANLSSIYDKGLLIPGERDNGIRVANGSVHGLGIYTATLCNPALSWGFCRAPTEDAKKLMVCGVLDDAPHSNFNAYTMGSRTVKTESQNVRHVGHAMVVFDDRRVAPLFEVSLGEVADEDLHKDAPFFDWSRWAGKVNKVLQRTPVKDPRPRRPLLQWQAKKRTIFAYVMRRGARKRSLRSM